MVQGVKKFSGGNASRKAETAAKAVKQQRHNASKTKKGAPRQLPKGQFRNLALDDHDLTKAIDKSNEVKIAAKLIQDGGRVGLTDIMQRGKVLNKENRRSQVKKKLTRVEEKLEALKEKAEKEGLV